MPCEKIPFGNELVDKDGNALTGYETLDDCMKLSPCAATTGACVFYQTLTACYEWSPSPEDPDRILVEGPCDQCGDECWSGDLNKDTGFCVEKSSESECLSIGGEWMGYGSFQQDCYYSACNDMYFLFRDCPTPYEFPSGKT
jgi:hypothetical protein